jgi:hypothetical protein
MAKKIVLERNGRETQIYTPQPFFLPLPPSRFPLLLSNCQNETQNCLSDGALRRRTIKITEHQKLYAVGWKLHCLHVRSHLQPIFINAHQTRMYKYYPLSRGVTSIIEQKDPMCFSLNFCGMNDCQCVDILKIGGLDADIDELVIFCS